MNPTNQPRDKNGRFASTTAKKDTKKTESKYPTICFHSENYQDTLMGVYDHSPEFPNWDEVEKDMLEAARGCVWDMNPWVSTFGFIATPMKLGPSEFRVTFWVRPEMVQ